MPAAVASASHAQLPAGPMARSSQDISPRTNYQALAPGAPDRDQRKNSTPVVVVGEKAAPPQQDVSSDGKRTSPNALRPGPPKIVVKKEPPSSPENAVPKRRPRNLDLMHSNAGRHLNGPATAAPSLGMQDVGIACLSPGFQTHDPAMREQLARSMSVRDQQRSLIEQRLQKNNHGGPKTNDRPNDDHHDNQGPGGLRPPPTGKKRGPPPGLSIGVPNASSFANERAIQSAPLNATFTGRHDPNPHAIQPRQPNGAPGSMQAPLQTANRLPPIGDVFGGMGRPPTAQYPSSPGFPPPSAPAGQQQLAPSVPPPPITNRPREYRSAEEAVAEMTQGREDLQPKIVHYGGHQPPTPPSPQPGQQGHTPTKHPAYQQQPPQPQQTPQSYPPQHAPQPPPSAGYAPPSAPYQGPPPSSGARRRPRSEYERDNGSPPLGSGPSPRGHRGAEFAHQAAHGYGPFGTGRDSPATQRAKKDEFMACVARAWDLWHS